MIEAVRHGERFDCSVCSCTCRGAAKAGARRPAPDYEITAISGKRVACICRDCMKEIMQRVMEDTAERNL